MRNLRKEIEEFEAKVHDKKLGKFPADLVDLTVTITAYAHRNQKRLNGDDYYKHPFRMCEQYLKLIEMPYNQINHEKLDLYPIPNKSIEELCCLHDVIEDTDITIEDLKEIYKSYGYQEIFEKEIVKPLLLLTHNKNETYEIYINKMINNPEACLVKFLDMNDNLNMFELNQLGDEGEKRAIKYIHYLKVINNKWRFVETFDYYHRCIRDY